MKITKYSGEIVNFKEEKLIKSMVSSGADVQTAKEILKEIEPQFYEGIPSKKIYKLAFQKLKTISKAHAARYSLKNGIMALGPAGFYFEKFISRLFELQDYTAITNLFLEGKCTSHEIDVLIKNDNRVAMVECKFHGSQEVKTDVKIPMYILSRFNDLKTTLINHFSSNEFITKCWLVTNNKFTSEAIKFGECSGLSLLSWDYPIDNALKDLVKKYKVYPITCLTTLTIAEKEVLLLQDVLTVYNLIHDKNGFAKLKLSQSRLKNVQNECNQLLNN
uniref:restriction endonuclease n=1 Tax=Flavobacterium sp. TaxID=239 RepID=UPI00404A9719